MTTLEKLKLQLGIKDDSQDGLLALLLDDVQIDLLAWTNRKELPAGLEPVQRQVAIIRYNMQGVEGQIAHSEGGVSRTFEQLPAPLKDSIARYRLLKVASYASPTT